MGPVWNTVESWRPCQFGHSALSPERNCEMRPARICQVSKYGRPGEPRATTASVIQGPKLGAWNLRNLVEWFGDGIKQCRCIATHFDKLAANSVALVQLASIRLWHRVNDTTPASKAASVAKAASHWFWAASHKPCQGDYVLDTYRDRR